MGSDRGSAVGVSIERSLSWGIEVSVVAILRILVDGSEGIENSAGVRALILCRWRYGCLKVEEVDVMLFMVV